MKKILALILSLVLAFSVTSMASAELGATLTLEPKLLSIMDQTSSEWYGDSTSRVLLATCALMDVILSDYEVLSDIAGEAVLNDCIYVATDGTSLLVMFFGDEQVVTVSYLPTFDMLSAFYANGGSTAGSYFMSSLKSEGLITSYYTVSSEDVMTMFQLILDTLNGQ